MSLGLCGEKDKQGDEDCVHHVSMGALTAGLYRGCCCWCTELTGPLVSTTDVGLSHRLHIFTRDETGSVYLPTQLERTRQLYW